jgi:TonB family protein
MDRRVGERREDTEAAFVQPEHTEELEVAHWWRSHLLEVTSYREPMVLRVGEGAVNDIVIPSEGVPYSFELVELEEEGLARLHFTPEMEGSVRLEGKHYLLSDLRDRHSVLLGREDSAFVSIGQIGFRVRFITPEPRIKAPPIFEGDALTNRTAIGSFLLGLFFFIAYGLVPPPKAVEVRMVPQEAVRWVKIKPRPRPQPRSGKAGSLLESLRNGSIGKSLQALLGGERVSGFGNAVRDHGLVGESLAPKGVETGTGGTLGIEGPSTGGHGGPSPFGTGLGTHGKGPDLDLQTDRAQILSGLSKDVIDAVIQRHRAEIRACYSAQLQRNPRLKGKVVVRFTIQPSGLVSSTGIKESTVGDGALESCILARVRSWVFPKPEAPSVTEVGAYPFYLSLAE